MQVHSSKTQVGLDNYLISYHGGVLFWPYSRCVTGVMHLLNVHVDLTLKGASFGSSI